MAAENFKTLTKRMGKKRGYFWRDNYCLYEEASQWERFPKFMIRIRSEFERKELTRALRAEGFTIAEPKRKEEK